MNDIRLVVEPLIPALRRYARAQLRDRATADDLLQDCLERVIAHWYQRWPGGDARAWIFTILHNLTINRLRQTRRRGPLAELEDVDEAQIARPATQEEGLHFQQALRALHSLLEDWRPCQWRGLGRGRRTITMSRRLAIVALSSIAMMGAPVLAWAEEVCVMIDSAPTANAVIGGRSSEFFVRFDRPVDHIRSTLDITRDGKLVEELHPRLESAPEVVFARAPTLPAGNYKLHWSVRTMTTGAATQGDIPFTVKDQP